MRERSGHCLGDAKGSFGTSVAVLGWIRGRRGYAAAITRCAESQSSLDGVDMCSNPKRIE